MEIVEHIASVPMFRGLPGENHEDLAMIVVDQFIEKGRLIFSEGDHADGFYVVLSGRVKIFKLSFEGKEQILHIMTPGEPFGEVSMFSGERFPAYAEALEQTRAFFFPRDRFVELLGRTPSLALNMLGVLSRRLRKFTSLVEDLSLKEVPGRLAAYLLYLSQREAGAIRVELEISKGQLASLLGTIPETLSRILARMTKEELIESDTSRRIRILDRQALAELAAGERRLT